jgi:archaetidylinositol phosphate synthase
MTLDRFRSYADWAIDPWVRGFDRVGLSPDAVSGLAFLLAVGAGGSFVAGGRWAEAWYAVGAGLVLLNGWFDVVDGALARAQGVDSEAGDLLDHVLDRYADVAIVAGLAAGVDAFAVGFAAVTGVLMTSYLGTQTQAVGLTRTYGGLLGRADRLVLVGLAAAAEAVVDVSAYGLGIVGWLLVVFAVVGHFTAVQRFWGGWRDLR